jgi:hypothetical protein
MNKQEKLKKIKKLWNSKAREYQWEDLKFGPDECCCDASPYNLVKFPDVEWNLVREGFYLWVWCRKRRGWLTWDHILLSWIQAWFYLPEEHEAVLFINEAARVVCISTARHSSRFAFLFQNPHSVLLGAEISDVEKEIQTPAGALELPPITTSKAVPAPASTVEAAK